MSERGTVHLVVGSTGAGKSTYARNLADQTGGVVLTLDAWMRELFFPDRPSDAGSDWYMDRIARATAVIWKVAAQIAKTGTGY